LQLATTLVLPAHPTSLRLARHATFAWLQFAPQRYDKDTVLLLVTELLANALEYSKGPLVLSVSAVDDQMRVEVRDAGPVERTGLRLKMVQVLAQRWGVETRLVDDQAARVVWFECAPTRIPRQRPGRDGSDTLDGRDAT
jgi:anti-sigma regulatory factor (Ser/Thr protein kinase)